MDIEFEKRFDLNNYETVEKLLTEFGTLSINNNIKIDLTNIREIRFSLKKF